VTTRSLSLIAAALDKADCRYLIVGGVAVVAHGYPRFTAGVDVVLDPDPAAILRAIEALSGLGYTPRAPVPFIAFADPAQRDLWAREKQMLVFSVNSPSHAATEIDLFLETPFAFEAAWERALHETLDGVPFHIVGRDDLIALKRAAGRPRDLEDVAALEALAREERRDG
jgi:hypothetical protein